MQQTKHGTRHALIGAILGCLLVLSPLAVQGADTVRVGQAPPARAEAKLGRTAATESLSVSLPLVTDKAAIDAFIGQLYDPKSPEYHKYLTPQQFTDRFVDRAARDEVTRYLTGQGLKVTSGNTGSLVTADGTAAQMERAFGVVLSDYRAADGRVFYAADQAAALPAAVANRVHGVEGLESAEQDRPHFIPGPSSPPSPQANAEPRYPSGCSAAVSIANRYGGFTPNQIATAYSFDPIASAGYHGEGQTVALFEEDDYADANILVNDGCYSGVSAFTVPLTRIINGPAPTLGSGQPEVELDIEVVTNAAPKLSRILVYETTNNTSNATALYQRIANDNLAQTVSTSWGNCELNRSAATVQAHYTIFQQMATQGMSMFAAAGDIGSQDCNGNTAALSVDEPAAQPYVTGVGGTTLALSANNVITGEATWNEYTNGYGATGGGPSFYYFRPSFQDAITTNGQRQVPDVAADADPLSGYVVYSQGRWAIFGGTSAAAPLWAAATALINQDVVAHGGSRVGFANAALYSLYARVPGAFRDITSGNNCYQGPACGTPGAGQYPAGPGFDLTTGLGSLNAFAIAMNLAPPAPTVSSVSPLSGPSSGGFPVQVNGSNFLTGATVSFGGTAAPGVSFVNANTLSVTAPALCCGTVSVTVTNPNGIAATLPNAFTFIAPPTLSSLSPATGVNSGNTVVNVSGLNFQSGATVSIGGQLATNVNVVNANTISVRTPAGKVGAAAVVVKNPDGQTATLPTGFTYTGPVITGTSSPTAYSAGGATYTITGTGFQPGATVAFAGDGTAYALNVQVNGGGTQITLTLPEHRQGLADVVVANPDGSDAVQQSGIQFLARTEGAVSGMTPAMQPPGGHAAAATMAAATPLPQPVRH